MFITKITPSGLTNMDYSIYIVLREPFKYENCSGTLKACIFELLKPHFGNKTIQSRSCSGKTVQNRDVFTMDLFEWQSHPMVSP